MHLVFQLFSLGLSLVRSPLPCFTFASYYVTSDYYVQVVYTFIAPKCSTFCFHFILFSRLVAFVNLCLSKKCWLEPIQYSCIFQLLHNLVLFISIC